MDSRLDPDELRRYSRHLVLPEIGLAGQERLKAARIAVVGLGGLGSPLALYLAAAGVGTLGLVEFDAVDETNLQRQVLYATADVGRPKVGAAAERLGGLNPRPRLELHELHLNAGNALDVLGKYDLVCDGSDNFSTRYVVNDACVRLGIPSVYGSILRFEGQVSVFHGARGPCYRCLFPSPPPAGSVPSCGEAGVLGVLPGIIGALQANEALKLVLGLGESLLGRLLTFDALRTKFRELALRRNPSCEVCSRSPEEVVLRDEPDGCEATVGPDPQMFDVEVAEVAQWRREGRGFQLLDVRMPEENRLARIQDSILIPLHQLPERFAELDAQQDVVVYCHYGPRSSYATQFLRQQGMPRVWNLAGGIDAWSAEVDARVPRY